MKRASISIVLSLAVIAGTAEASGSGGASQPIPQTPERTPEQMAAANYNDGLSRVKKADEHMASAAQESDARKRAKHEEKARKDYEKAIKEFRHAVDRQPELYQAHSMLGYALRKIGDYPQALDAYDKALELSPGFTPAIEYRAEAYLGLDRLDDVKSSYLALFGADRERADELMAAMRRWVETRKADPGSLPAADVETFASWVAERDKLASQTRSPAPSGATKW